MQNLKNEPLSILEKKQKDIETITHKMENNPENGSDTSDEILGKINKEKNTYYIKEPQKFKEYLVNLGNKEKVKEVPKTKAKTIEKHFSYYIEENETDLLNKKTERNKEELNKETTNTSINNINNEKSVNNNGNNNDISLIDLVEDESQENKQNSQSKKKRGRPKRIGISIKEEIKKKETQNQKELNKEEENDNNNINAEDNLITLFNWIQSVFNKEEFYDCLIKGNKNSALFYIISNLSKKYGLDKVNSIIEKNFPNKSLN